MARREWALKIVGKQVFHDRRCGPIVNFPRAVKLVTVEHARALRIVKAQMKAAQLDQHTWLKNERDGYLSACRDILTMLQQGRA